MTPKPNEPDRIIKTVKEWLTPSLVTIVGIMLWTELNELKSDVKTLLVKTSVTEAKLAMLEKEIDYIREKNCEPYGIQQYTVPPFERATPKKEEGPKIPNGEGSDKEHL